MKIIVVKTYEELSEKASDIVEEVMRKNEKPVLGLATGSTPIGMYKDLIRKHKAGKLDFSKTITFNLDEYIGISKEDPSSYNYYMENEFFKHINIEKENAHVPKPSEEDQEIEKYGKYLEECGGIDIQVLGIGPNGHIAFNEPDDYLLAHIGIVDLTEDTIKANSRFFQAIEYVPTKAVTMGMADIFAAKKIILLANGLSKADAIKSLLKENLISTRHPASLLKLHRDVTIIVDEEAYSKVEV